MKRTTKNKDRSLDLLIRAGSSNARKTTTAYVCTRRTDALVYGRPVLGKMTIITCDLKISNIYSTMCRTAKTHVKNSGFSVRCGAYCVRRDTDFRNSYTRSTRTPLGESIYTLWFIKIDLAHFSPNVRSKTSTWLKQKIYATNKTHWLRAKNQNYSRRSPRAVFFRFFFFFFSFTSVTRIRSVVHATTRTTHRNALIY